MLQDSDLAPATLALREPSLDDVFIALTGHRTDSDATADGRTVAEAKTNGAKTGRMTGQEPRAVTATCRRQSSDSDASPQDRSRVRSGSSGSCSTP